MLSLPRQELTAREFFLVVEEAMVEEIRRSRLDLYSRTKFTEEGDEIEETRTLVSSQFEVTDEDRDALEHKNVEQLSQAAMSGFVEVD